MANKHRSQHVAKNIDGVTHIMPRKQYRLLQYLPSVNRITICSVFIVILCLGVFGVSRLRGQPNLENPNEIKQVLSNHIIVPNEQPVIATVTDRTALKTPFLQESEDGDKIIIFEKARRVVIYRPSLDRIVDIGPVELDNIPKT